MKIFRLSLLVSMYFFPNARCTAWLCGSIICWQRCNGWNWWGRPSGAVLGWRSSGIKRPSLYAWVRPAQVGVRETSMQAWRKARRASHESKTNLWSKFERARDCWKIGNAVLHIHTHKCVHCMELCMWVPNLRERVCAGRCYATWGSNEWRLFTSFAPQTCKIEFWP